MQGTASLWLTGRSGRLSSEATLDPSRAGDEAVTLARSDASAAEEAGFIIDAASNLAGRLRVRMQGRSAPPLNAPHACILLDVLAEPAPAEGICCGRLQDKG